MKKILVRLIAGIGLVGLLALMAEAQWVQTNGPGAGFITSLAVSGDTILAGTYDGLFISTITSAIKYS